MFLKALQIFHPKNNMTLLTPKTAYIYDYIEFNLETIFSYSPLFMRKMSNYENFLS